MGRPAGKSYLDQVDLARIQRRFDAFWRREVPDWPLVSITAPQQNAKQPTFRVPETLEERWLNVEYVLDRTELALENTAFFGDAIPFYMPNIGPDSFTAYLGGELRFIDEGTSWVVPFVEDLNEFSPLFDRANKWWRFVTGLVEAACERGAGRYLIGIPDLHGGADALAAARHPDKLALDLFDKPGEVHRLMRTLTDIYYEVYEAYCGKISRVQQGSITWLPAYSRGRYSALQNDFSGLVSPEMFTEFFRDEIAELSRYLDNSIYHLDGPTALGNLPHLLDIEALDGVQWVPGSGAPPMSEWIDVCRTILDAGKCLQIGCRSDEVEYLLARLPHEGLFLTTSCSGEAEARELLARVRQAAQ